MDRQAWRDFFITVFFLGIAFVIAVLSSIAAEQNRIRLAAVSAAVSLLLALLGALYIIPRLARNIRLDILRFAVRTTVTVEGLFFLVLLVVIWFAAWNTGNNLLYLILSAMLAFLLAGNLIARMSLGELSVQLRFPDHVFAGEPAILTITLVNHKRLLPSYSLLIEALSEPGKALRVQEADESEGSLNQESHSDQSGKLADRKLRPRREASIAPGLGDLGKLAYFVTAPPHSSARQTTEYTFEKRGRYPITGFRISTKFPSGFFKKWRRIDASGEILVYPKPRSLDDFYHALPILTGQIQSQARGWGDDLYMIRRYNPSDQLRHIDWKATAKSTHMMVRDLTRQDEWRLTIVFDTTQPAAGDAPRNAMSSTADGVLEASLTERADQGMPAAEPASFEERFERAIIMAASLANHFMLEGSEVELITPRDEHHVKSGKGQEHLYQILRSLATLYPEASSPEPSPPQPAAAAEQGSIGPAETRGYGRQADERTESASALPVEWNLLDRLPALADERRFKVLITPAAKGTIPGVIWRSAHVVFMEDL